MKKLVFLFILFLFVGTVNAGNLMSLTANVFDSFGNPVNGRITIEIFSAATGGTLIYNETFPNNISTGKVDIMLGSFTTPLNLNYGTNYFMNINAAGTDLNFDGKDRKEFTSYIGNVSTYNATYDSFSDTDTNVTTECGDNELLLGNGTCVPESNYADTDTTYTADDNLTLTGNEFGINGTAILEWLDNIYQSVGAYLTSTQLNASYLLVGENITGVVDYTNLAFTNESEQFDYDLNVTGNLTLSDRACFTSICSAYIYHNGSSLIIES